LSMDYKCWALVEGKSVVIFLKKIKIFKILKFNI
jgi:hypothetical protein